MDQSTATPRTAPGKTANTILWIVQVMLAVSFVVPAYRKLSGNPTSVELFDDLGFGQWLRYAVGLLELALAAGLLVPRLAGAAALGLVVVMTGATATELSLESGRWPGPLGLLVISAIIAYARRRDIAALLRRG